MDIAQIDTGITHDNNVYQIEVWFTNEPQEEGTVAGTIDINTGKISIDKDFDIEDVRNFAERFLSVKFINKCLQDIYMSISIDTPSNHDDIIEFILDDVTSSADEDFSDGDVSIAFRRFIES